jgi:hypothetical protein
VTGEGLNGSFGRCEVVDAISFRIVVLKVHDRETEEWRYMCIVKHKNCREEQQKKKKKKETSRKAFALDKLVDAFIVQHWYRIVHPSLTNLP